MAIVLKVIEQKSLMGKSIFCEVVITNELNNCFTRYNNMYFVCNLNREVIQYFSWLEEYREEVNKLGYKF